MYGTYAALTWDGTNYRVFLNGTAVITQANSSPPYASNEVIQIGTSKSGSGGSFAMFYQGYMDDIRITNGVARYTSTFTPPTVAHGKFLKEQICYLLKWRLERQKQKSS